MLWDDDKVFTIGIRYIKTTLMIATEKNGLLYASYETLDVDDNGYAFGTDENGALCTHVIPEGIYGQHPLLSITGT